MKRSDDKVKWVGVKGSRDTGGCVKRADASDPEPFTSDWVCFLQKQDDESLDKSRLALIALIPDLVRAADLLNGLAVTTENTIPSVRREFTRATKIVRRAKELLDNEPKQGGYDRLRARLLRNNELKGGGK